MMNVAQKKTWQKLAISAAGMLVMGGALAMMRVHDWSLTDPGDHTALRVLGLLSTIPLILLALLERGWKKVYDERDLHIEHRAVMIGATVAFVLFAGAAVVLVVLDPLGSIKTYTLPSLVYLGFFASVLASSVAAVIQYNWGAEHGQ